jgi:negative regulator of flagellin synthesis FlgM
MRVNNDSITSGTDKLQKSGVENVGKSKIGAYGAYSDNTVKPEGHASVSLSNRAQEISRFSEAAANAPEVGAERVAELRQSIQNGSYKIDHQQLAADIME